MQITKYSVGSLKELWAISFPLMLSSLSVMLMVFVDRLFLSQYSSDAFTASVSASTLGWSLLSGFMVLTSIAEVFVAQYNGAGQYHRLAAPVWQMIWVSLGSFFFFFPMYLFGGNLIWGNSDSYAFHRDYFRWLMFFGPSFAFNSAISSYFVGIGRTKVITILAFGSNFINIFLDRVLIFGLGDFIPEMGVEGAAIATCGSNVFQACVLFFFFLRPSSRKAHRTGCWKIERSLMERSLWVGLPGALFTAVQVLGFYVYYVLMAQAGKEYIVIGGLTQTVAILFYFFNDGVHKGVATVVGNQIGANKQELVISSVKAGLRLHFFYFIAMFVFFFFLGDLYIFHFTPKDYQLELADLYFPIRLSCALIICQLFFEGVRTLFAGVLTAAGDTRFLMIGGSLSVWILLVAPVYLTITMMKGPVEMGALCCLFYSSIASVLYFFRFKKGNWQEISLIKILKKT